jgi:hypothetical protein
MTAAEYERNVEKASSMAEATAEAELKLQWMRIAALWRFLAYQARQEAFGWREPIQW